MLSQKLKKCFLFLTIYSSASLAGPPFITDDPYLVDYKHWQIYFFSSLDKAHDNLEMEIPGVEINYGLGSHLELDTTIPIVYNKPYRDGPNGYGSSDWELELKYAFMKENQYLPQIAFNPSYIIPVGNAERGLGNGQGWFELPIWIGKTWNKWQTYGGGGYAKNAAKGERNFFFGGIVIQQNVTEHLMLGGEIYSQGADANDANSFTIMNIGGSYYFTKEVGLLVSVGHSIKGEEHFVSYLALSVNL